MLLSCVSFDLSVIYKDIKTNFYGTLSRVDSAEGAYRERTAGPLGEEESDLTAQASAMQETLAPDLDNRSSEPDAPQPAPGHGVSKFLDIKYNNSLTNTIPAFTSARNVAEAKAWLDTAHTSRDIPECAGNLCLLQTCCSRITSPHA